MLPINASIALPPGITGDAHGGDATGMIAHYAKLGEEQERFARTCWNEPNLAGLLAQTFAHSPYLSRLICNQPAFFEMLCRDGFDAAYANWAQALVIDQQADETALMRELRVYKQQGALLIGLADIAGYWTGAQVTQALSALAESTLKAAVDFLLRRAIQQGTISGIDIADPSRGSGLIVLGMGKLGGGELNYSSDIDLVILFDPDAVAYHGRQSAPHFFTRLAVDLTRLMQERTADGYVFRTDLRLRPDPRSMPAAVNIQAALAYYETVGQNWERAAFIKARPVAGDIEAGERFLRQLDPFLWRRNLDFAAIADIQSIKRQMDHSPAMPAQLFGHNIKTGLGGIREIEFITQIYQLIWGGRQTALRVRATVPAMRQLAAFGVMREEDVARLSEYYWFLRMVEHRLQMIDDQQTHRLPDTAEGMFLLARFAGYDADEFVVALTDCLHTVHGLFVGLFATGGDLTAEGSLVFTGVDLDEATRSTLEKLGFSQPDAINAAIQSWHRGGVRACRSPRAREMLTELTPSLLRAFGASPHPDQAFGYFSRFIERLPSGVQIFSLLRSNPQLLALLATIMGSAPRLANQLSRWPDRLDAILSASHHAGTSDTDDPAGLALARDTEDRLRRLARFRNEQEFLIGCRLLQRQLSVTEANEQLSRIAEIVIGEALMEAKSIFTAQHGTIDGGEFAVLALGRLGSRQTTFGSDLDLVFIYRVPKEAVATSLPPASYYARLVQRLTGLLQSQTPEGRLYDVDTRLRPSGKEGPLASEFSAFCRYFEQEAWGFESLALVRARPVAGDAALLADIESTRHLHIQHARHGGDLLAHIAEIRAKTAREFGDDNPLDLKYCRGGSIDLAFIAQALVLLNPDRFAPDLHRPADIFSAAKDNGLLPAHTADILLTAEALQEKLLTLSRLAPEEFARGTLVAGLADLALADTDYTDFDALLADLAIRQNRVRDVFDQFISNGTLTEIA